MASGFLQRIARMFGGGRGVTSTWPSVPPAEDPEIQNALACNLIKLAHAAYLISKPNPIDAGNKDYASIATLQPLSPEGAPPTLQAAFGSAGGERVVLGGKDQGFRDAALAALYDGFAVVAFRGTIPLDQPGAFDQAIRDWLNDANARLIPLQGLGTVHSGFHQSYMNVWPAIEKQLQAWIAAGKWDGKTLYITGHSKGGAMAVLAAGIRARPKRSAVTRVVTFAGARAGSQAFVDAYTKLGIPTFRYENYFDLVPHLPPTARELDQLAHGNPVLYALLRNHDPYESAGQLFYIQENVTVIKGTPANALEAFRTDRFVEMFHDLADTKAAIDSLAPNHAITPPPYDKTKPVANDCRYYRTVVAGV
jgi:Lipase (class 3)